MEKKMVRKEVYTKLMEVLETRDFSNITDEEMVLIKERLVKDIENASKKRNGNDAKTKENEELANKVYEYMTSLDSEEIFVADIMKEFDLNNQKASYIVRSLREDGRVARNDKKTDGKVTYRVI